MSWLRFHACPWSILSFFRSGVRTAQAGVRTARAFTLFGLHPWLAFERQILAFEWPEGVFYHFALAFERQIQAFERPVRCSSPFCLGVRTPGLAFERQTIFQPISNGSITSSSGVRFRPTTYQIEGLKAYFHIVLTKHDFDERMKKGCFDWTDVSVGP